MKKILKILKVIIFSLLLILIAFILMKGCFIKSVKAEDPQEYETNFYYDFNALYFISYAEFEDGSSPNWWDNLRAFRDNNHLKNKIYNWYSADTGFSFDYVLTDSFITNETFYLSGTNRVNNDYGEYDYLEIVYYFFYDEWEQSSETAYIEIQANAIKDNEVIDYNYLAFRYDYDSDEIYYDFYIDYISFDKTFYLETWKDLDLINDMYIILNTNNSTWSCRYYEDTAVKEPNYQKGYIIGRNQGIKSDLALKDALSIIKDAPEKYGFKTIEDYNKNAIKEYNKGKDDGYKIGTDATNLSTSWFISIFTGISQIFNIKLLGGITLGMVVLIPLAISMAWFIIRTFRGGGGGS